MSISTKARTAWPGRRWRRVATAGMAVVALIISALALAGAAQPAAAASPPVLSAGGGHTCAVMADRSVWCWGQNTSGELGNGSQADSATPVKVLNTVPVTTVSSGFSHTCELDTANGVWCWGSDAFGELGNGATSAHHLAPVKVAGLAAVQVSAGRYFTCAVTVAQRAKCWGDNNYGELGDGSHKDSSVPRAVKGLTGVIAVSAGYFHACALLTTKRVYCWGSNTFGALGNGTTKSSDTPAPVTGLEGAVSVDAGNDYTCAILTGGGLKCWGDNSVGQLGNGSFTDAHVPTQVAGLTANVQMVSLGEDTTCAVVAAPAFTGVCWGDADGHGQLGDGLFSQDRPLPTKVFGMQGSPAGAVLGPESISVGSHHVCAAMYAGQAECWGEGAFGDIGDGSKLDRAIPTLVIGLPGSAGTVAAVAAGLWTSCAITSTLHARCWGHESGDGSLANQKVAVAVKNFGSAKVVGLAPGYGGCAMTSTGVVRCWGDNSWGQIGNGNTKDQPSPVKVGSLPAVESVATGGRHVCVLIHNGGADCWGSNFWGQLGDGTTTQRHHPVAVKNLPLNMAQIAAGASHTCALLKNGSVRCWGRNAHGELGDNSTSDHSKPVSVTGLPKAVQIALGDSFSCALTVGGGVKCWGVGNLGQLGDGGASDSHVPVTVSGLASGVVAITAGDAHACAVLLVGTVECWGDNSTGELGNGSKVSQSLVPVPVSGFSSDQKSLSANSGQVTCGLDSSERAMCWGMNANGELGDNSLMNSNVPVLVQNL